MDYVVSNALMLFLVIGHWKYHINRTTKLTSEWLRRTEVRRLPFGRVRLLFRQTFLALIVTDGHVRLVDK